MPELDCLLDETGVTSGLKWLILFVECFCKLATCLGSEVSIVLG
jgi:hypothetical protein